MFKYSIITPVKNEYPFICSTLNSIIKQTIMPLEWIIVDDGSNDGTETIIREYEKKFDWIKVIDIKCLNVEDYSSRVVSLFEEGRKHLKSDYDFLSKLDGDVSFEADFYETILKEFDCKPTLGIASGYLTINRVPEKIADTKFVCTRGATKVYRKKCIEDIGGLVPFQGWDTLDNVAARAKGWDVAIINSYFEHLKEEGSKIGSKIFSCYRTGFYNGAVPYYVPYFFIKVLVQFSRKPFFICSFMQIVGFVYSYLIVRKRPYPEFIVNQLKYEQKETLKKYLFN